MSKRKTKRITYRPQGFDCLGYAETFSFCTTSERIRLAHLLHKAWRWAHPLKTMEDMAVTVKKKPIKL